MPNELLRKEEKWLPSHILLLLSEIGAEISVPGGISLNEFATVHTLRLC